MICENCGKEIAEGAAFCPSCGKAAGNGPGASAAAGADENKTMCVLAYILFFVPLLTGAHKTSGAVRFHTNQGTVLFIFAVIYGVAYSILSAILIFIPVVGWIVIMLLGLLSLGIVALCVIGIINAVNSRQNPLPLIGKFNIIK
jgi:uncharacterized membrane protein